jgi:hypothetical protein
LHLFLNRPGAGGAGQLQPAPGGWNRFQIATEDLALLVEKLRAEASSLRSEIITGNGGKQVLVDDPSGNPIELFEPFPAR